MSHPWAKVHKIFGEEGLRWQSIIVPTHPKYKIMRIKSKGSKLCLEHEHRENEAQLLLIALHGAANYGLGRGQTLENVHYYIGRVATSPCLFKKALFFVMNTHSSFDTNLPLVAMLLSTSLVPTHFL